MFPSDMRKRRDWFLPLVGGAEINRIQNKAPPPLIFTSRPYPYELMEEVTTSAVLRTTPTQQFLDDLSVVSLIMGGTLRDVLQTLPTWPTESLQCLGSITSGTLVGITYKSLIVPTHNVQVLPSITGGSLRTVLVVYTRWATENVQPTSTIISGTLT